MTKSVSAQAKIRSAVLAAALEDAAFEGWNDALLAVAGRKAGIPAAELREAFPNGAASLSRCFSDWADEAALRKLKLHADMRIRDKIAAGVRARLEILAPHKPAVAASLSYMSLPPRNIALPKMVWRTADALWRAAGDTATDYNHYTKRLLLSGVLVSTTLYWLNDSSDGHDKTWQFLERRIEEVLKVGQRLSSLKKKPGQQKSETPNRKPGRRKPSKTRRSRKRRAK
jgi:ubiquinone biosynthesis protein COQ9